MVVCVQYFAVQHRSFLPVAATNDSYRLSTNKGSNRQHVVCTYVERVQFIARNHHTDSIVAGRNECGVNSESTR